MRNTRLLNQARVNRRTGNGWLWVRVPSPAPMVQARTLFVLVCTRSRHDGRTSCCRTLPKFSPPRSPRRRCLFPGPPRRARVRPDSHPCEGCHGLHSCRILLTQPHDFRSWAFIGVHPTCGCILQLRGCGPAGVRAAGPAKSGCGRGGRDGIGAAGVVGAMAGGDGALAVGLAASVGWAAPPRGGGRRKAKCV